MCRGLLDGNMEETKYNFDFVNTLDYDDFLQTFGNVIEHCPVITAAVWSNRPFRNVDSLQECFTSIVDALPFTMKEGILRCHPDLAGRMALQGTLTDESTKEQSSAGLLDLTEDERNMLTTNNKLYKDKFGVPFVICVRLNKKEAIMRGIEERLNNFPEEEILKGIEEVMKICHIRLSDIVKMNSEAKL